MIITKLRLQEEHPMTGVTTSWPLPSVDLNLDLTAGDNGYILKQALGLGPPPLIAVVVGFDSSGIPIWDNIPEERAIVLKIGFNPGYSQPYGALRDALYKYVSRTVFVKLMNDTIILAQSTGFIQRLEPIHFSNKPELEMTIICEDGAFNSPQSLPIPLATLIDIDTPLINYEEGTAPAGLDLQFEVNTAHDDFTISNHSEFWHSGSGDVDNEFTVEYSFEVDDVVTISTHPVQRITLLRDAVTYDLAGYINAGAVWPKLYTGVNTFEWTFDSDWMDWVSASYTPRHWGV